MALFKMVKYHRREYPPSIPINIEEIAGHFDVKSTNSTMDYSIHTEYSYGKRKFLNKNLAMLDLIVSSNKKGVPQLWKCETWAEEFAKFILRQTRGLSQPKVIEIHPPFDDYVEGIKSFILIYKLFEDIIKNEYPNTEIHIENRSGSIYSGGKFVISNLQQLMDLCEQIEKYNLKLKVAFDIIQLYTAHSISLNKKDLITKLLNDATNIRKYIGGVHLWGKKLSKNGRKIAHYGDLNSYFNYDFNLKYEFISTLGELFNDNVCRNLVLEVNSSNNDILSIIEDLSAANFKYI